MSREVFLVAAGRTAIAPRGTAFQELPPHILGAAIVKSLLGETRIPGTQVDELIAGNSIGPGGNLARLVSLEAGLPETVAGLTIDRQCCGGLDALLLAEALVGSGNAEIVIAGGVESYSQRPIRQAPGASEPYDQPPFTPWPDRDPSMAAAASRLAGNLGISRRQQDAWAVDSHRKAIAARQGLKREIVPVPRTSLAEDSYARQLNERICRRARPICGSVTLANTAVAADGAAFCVVASAKAARRFELDGIRMAGGITLGGDPELPGLAPVAAIGKATGIASVSPGELQVAEIMEAFACQAIACVDQAGLDPGRVNPGGGALARGHPIGASGAVLAVRLYSELNRIGAGYGLAAIAAAGGLGTALALEAGGS